MTRIRHLAREAAPPLIGITASELHHKGQVALTDHGEPGQSTLSLGLAYAEAVAGAGGVPVILAPCSDVGQLVERLDGIVLSGGPDIDPVRYGQDRQADVGPVEPEIDAFELALCDRALTRGTPLLGICRGMQLLNVAAGGTLHQHIPDLLGPRVLHRGLPGGDPAAHDVTVTEPSVLATLIGSGVLHVNSFHHQAIDRLADGLRVVARSSDGIVEAVEGTGAALVLGVQWHVESLTADPRHAAILHAFIGAASRFELERSAVVGTASPTPRRLAG
jgi:putative glutamine amidotransferase